MRKVFVVVGIVAIVVGYGALSGSGLNLPGAATNATVPLTPVLPPTSTPDQSAFLAPTPAGQNLSASPGAAQVITSPNQIVTTIGPLVLLNPSRARPGSTVGVTGSGFDPGSTIDLFLKHQVSDAGKSLGFVQADKEGGFGGFNLTMPADFASGPSIIYATQHDGKKQAMATGTVAANSPVVAFGNT